MTDILDPLKPIAEIVGDRGVSANYSDSQFYRNGAYQSGWLVQVDATYRGATLRFSNKARTLQEAAEATLDELKVALGIA